MSLTSSIPSAEEKIAVVTGVTGQDGSYLAELLLANPSYKKVIGLKRRTSLISTDRIDHLLQNPKFQLDYWDLTDSSSIYGAFLKHQPNEFYNLAAQSHVRVSFDVPCNTVDTVGPAVLTMLEALRQIRPSCRFYQASSSEMFGDSTDYDPNKGYNEESRMTPASPYACAKLFAHNLARSYRIGYGLHISCGILFNHESPRRGETFVTRKICREMAAVIRGEKEKFSLGNVLAKRDWGFAGDYVEAMYLMLQQDKPDDYVVATGKTQTVKRFLELVYSRATSKYGLKKRLPDIIETDHRLFRPHEVPFLLGDSTKAQKLLGWKPKTTVEDLANMMLDAEMV